MQGKEGDSGNEFILHGIQRNIICLESVVYAGLCIGFDAGAIGKSFLVPRGDQRAFMFVRLQVGIYRGYIGSEMRVLT